MDRAYYLREKISKIKGFKVDLQVPIFNEFVVEAEKDFTVLEKKLMDQKIFPGIDLAKFYPDLKNRFLVCATETKTQEQLDTFVDAVGKI